MSSKEYCAHCRQVTIHHSSGMFDFVCSECGTPMQQDELSYEDDYDDDDMEDEDD